MNIPNNSASNSFYGYVPLSEYNGIVLKLTKTDKKQIAQLQKQISEYNLDCYESQRNKSLKRKWTEKDNNRYIYGRNAILEKVDCLMKEIQDIKLARLEKQKKAKNKCKV